MRGRFSHSRAVISHAHPKVPACPVIAVHRAPAANPTWTDHYALRSNKRTGSYSGSCDASSSGAANDSMSPSASSARPREPMVREQLLNSGYRLAVDRAMDSCDMPKAGNRELTHPGVISGFSHIPK